MAFGKRRKKKDTRPEAGAAEETAAPEPATRDEAPAGASGADDASGDRPAADAAPAADDAAPGPDAAASSPAAPPAEPAGADAEDAPSGTRADQSGAPSGRGGTPAGQGGDAAEETADEPSDEEPLADRAATGPFDASERDEDAPYIDMGGLLIRPVANVNVRIDVDQKRQSVVSVTFQHGNSVLQAQAFAAPKSRGLWPEIRTELAESIRSQGGVVEVTDGPLGRQVTARIPAALPDGGRGFKIARFIGVDGPRWFLRGVVSGDAAVKAQAAEPLEEVFRSLVVVRGEEPMAPRDMLPLKVPDDAVARDPRADSAEEPDLQVPERGPETTQIG